MIIRREATKADLLNIFLSVETGKHVSIRGVDMIKIDAFRLEPLASDSHVTLDGEVLEYGPIQGHVVTGAGRLMVKR